MGGVEYVSYMQRIHFFFYQCIMKNDVIYVKLARCTVEAEDSIVHIFAGINDVERH